MASEEARIVATYLTIQRGPFAYKHALDHMTRLNACGNSRLAEIWKDIALEVALIEAQAGGEKGIHR
jgi:hypothetical protein